MFLREILFNALKPYDYTFLFKLRYIYPETTPRSSLYLSITKQVTRNDVNCLIIDKYRDDPSVVSG